MPCDVRTKLDSLELNSSVRRSALGDTFCRVKRRDKWRRRAQLPRGQSIVRAPEVQTEGAAAYVTRNGV